MVGNSTGNVLQNNRLDVDVGRLFDRRLEELINSLRIKQARSHQQLSKRQWCALICCRILHRMRPGKKQKHISSNSFSLQKAFDCSCVFMFKYFIHSAMRLRRFVACR